MIRLLTVGLLLTCFRTSLYAQEQPPKVLLGAAHCLASDWIDLGNPKATVLSVGYFLDEKSYPGQKVVYVVVYAGPRRSDGQVFTVFLRKDKGHQIFDIQNNATFIRTHKKDAAFGKEGVDFVEPPLWGIWTQKHIARAIEQAGLQPRFTLRVQDVLKPLAYARCESLLDKSR